MKFIQKFGTDYIDSSFFLSFFQHLLKGCICCNCAGDWGLKLTTVWCLFSGICRSEVGVEGILHWQQGQTNPAGT